MDTSLSTYVAYATIGTFSLGALGAMYALVTRLVIGPMIERHISSLAVQLDARYISRNEIELMRQASDENHRRTVQEIRDIWAQINAIKSRP